MKITIEIPDESIEILKAINKVGGAEFRDSEYENLEAFKKSSLYNTEIEEGRKRDDDWFMRRNFCDKKLLEPLMDFNLIDLDYDSWHLTYVVTSIGKTVIKNLE